MREPCGQPGTMPRACGNHAIRERHEASKLKEPHLLRFTQRHVIRRPLHCLWHFIGWHHSSIIARLLHKDARASTT
jgi:hypothetical protein